MTTKITEQKMLLGGEWVGREQTLDVVNPEDQSVISTVPMASSDDAREAVRIAVEGKEIAEALSVRERMDILNKVADYVLDRAEEFAEIIALEGSKTIAEASGEARRTAETIRLGAEEARRLSGESINFDQMEGNTNRMGYYYHFPVGVVAAITPFNDPLNLVAHKVAPAIAAGNAVIVKPATETPLSALKLAEAFIAAGLPKKVLTVITGRGRDIGDILVEAEDVQMISFTGGYETGKSIAHKAGLKKLSMELGSNSPFIVWKDADIEKAAQSGVDGAFGAAGQNCLSVQRVYAHEEIYEAFEASFVDKAKQVRAGRKMDKDSDIGPVINEKEAKRIESWIEEAVEAGAKVLAGGKRHGAFIEPTVLSNVPEDITIVKEEVFGPVVILASVATFDEAVTRSNSVPFGLQAGIYTNDINLALKAVRKLHVGGVMVNDSSDFRIDAMPFGGVKHSGIGREGVAFAIEEMSEKRLVCFTIDE
ncbi:aldehyde dehydrogenase family protein [Marinococcus luteus]|uniref:aldehyde dehydrogenase family protein n=1 Tax=Marinococcus luteus TaxID=1122204 RepID=UPI002ACD0E7E|nr:aldehyde dehydrogenase family protein [Marinococcus luteus]MDZ5782248.1 aldehyde dehydrogenase family protein [Marinococcus luteus]